MYSDRPRQSRGIGERAQSTASSPVKEDHSDLSSNVVGPTIADASKFETLSVNDPVPAFDSTYSLSGRRPRNAKPVTAPRIRQSAMYSDRPRRSRGNQEQEQSPASSLVEEDHSDLSSNVVTLTINDLDPPLDSTRVDEDHSDLSSNVETLTINDVDTAFESTRLTPEEIHEIQEYLKEHTYDSWEAICEFWYSTGAATRPQAQPEAEAGDDEAVTEQSSQERSVEKPVLASEQGRWVLEGRPSKEQIAKNGMEWMREEVMVAFQKYFERQDNFKGFYYKLYDIQSQCFNIENYHHTFHHFNFTVEMKDAGSEDWTSKHYFAEVKEIFRRKIYFCCPLEEDENDHCYGCKNQGMDDLKHPMIGAYDRGRPDTVFPYMYEDSASDDEFAPNE